MNKKWRWLFAATPCVPGLTLLLAAGFVKIAAPLTLEWRAQVLFDAGSVVLVVGLLIGAFILWRITHPRPEPVEEKDVQPPTG